MAEGVTALPALLDHIAALTAERDALREALQAAHDLLSDERLGQWRYMESGDFYDDANKVVLTARAALGRNHDE